MASSFGIAVGPLTSVKNYQNDSQVQTVLLEFGEIRGLFTPDMSNQEKLDAIVEYLEAYILHHVHQHEKDLAAQAAESQIEAEFALE